MGKTLEIVTNYPEPSNLGVGQTQKFVSSF